MTDHRTVFIPLTGSEWPSVQNMFLEAGWEVSFDLDKDVNLVCFTGGSDVSPALYGEANTYSLCDPARDDAEVKVYQLALALDVPMVGICRGGQFLNVMNGGKMIQHIEGHSMGDREIIFDGIESCEIREDHHQGMVPHVSGHVEWLDPRDANPEIIWYPGTRCLCFQPHPEWGHEPTRKLFFQLIEEYIYEPFN